LAWLQRQLIHEALILRIDQTPEIEIHVIKSWEAPVGIGETGAMATAARIGRARKLRRSPVQPRYAKPLCRDRRALAANACGPRPCARRGGMMKPATRRILLGVVAVVVIAAA
jgi:hypothetical protein